ncbi:hypothetical protein LL06_20860 [Hoeflea sp. BAL378]|uniref:hypothetical protein n=1 Tax=Hoeflea sp. BAL378 TaxID=1547437 RepID=UPI0005143308|nr:hypothetical protein [Hoeflea sp. BAL378]KGF67679.1 hypothetical protein LL06_20860 [Hoeflea sp. BAL378]
MREREKIEQVRRGETDAGDLPGSTTERMTIGLALNELAKTNPGYASDEAGAWQKLDATQRRIVRDFNPEYRKKEWVTKEETAMAEVDREFIDGGVKAVMRWIELKNREEAPQ